MKGSNDLYISRPRLEEPFKQMLKAEVEPRVLNLYGDGGMGKTLLLQHYIEICEEENALHTEIVDFRRTKNRFPRAIAEAIAALDPDVFAEYHTSRKSLDEMRLLPLERPEQSYRDVEEQMDRYLIKGLDQLLAHWKLVILLDTWEKAAGTLVEEWVRSALLLDRFEKLRNRGNLLLVIAGRSPVEWKDIPVKPLKLGPFSLEETKKYASSRGYVDDPIAAQEKPALQIVANAHRASGGHPVIVAWAFDYGDRGINIGEIAWECGTDAEAFRRRLVEEIHLEENPLLAWAACLYRRFNASILHHISGWPLEECRSQIRQVLQDFPSILRAGEEAGSCELHDEARDMIINYGWKGMLDPTGEAWRQLRHSAIKYYNQVIERQSREMPIATLHAYIAEHLFYLLDQCEDVNCLKVVFHGVSFWRRFDKAINAYQTGLARSLLEEVSAFDKMFDQGLKNWYDVAYARLLAHQGREEEALELYKQILKRAGSDRKVIAQVKAGMGRCYYLKAKYEEALKAYSESLALRQQLGLQLKVADTISYIAMVYHAMGKWEEAKEQFSRSSKEALKIPGPEGQKRAALAADQAAQVALLMGDASTARSLTQQSWRIWEEINDNWGQARALSTWGRVEEFAGNFPEAEGKLRKALDFYLKGPMPSEFGQACVKTYLGRVYRRERRLSEAEVLVKDGVDVFKRLNRLEYLAFALCELGCIYRDKRKWKEAEERFNEAVKIAEKIKDQYRLAMLYEDLSMLGRQRGDLPEQIEKHLNKAEELAQERGYKNILARVELHRGDLAFETGDYRKAFDHYVKACHRFTEYHTDFYIRFLSHVEGKLYELPMEEIPTYCDQMMVYWRQHGLHHKHTALMDRFSKAKEIALAFRQ